MKKSFWFKIIAIIIIQAILLTQAEFALASTFSSKDLCREAALQYHQITTKTISLIFGIGCLQLNSKSLQLEKLFSLLITDTYSQEKNILGGNFHAISKDIYKVFALAFIIENDYNKYTALISNRIRITLSWMDKTQESRGPPMVRKNIDYLYSRIV